MTQRANIDGFGVVKIVNPNTATVGAMEDLQDDTGWDDEEIQKRATRATSRAAMGIYLSLRDAGHDVSYADVRALPQGAMTLLEETKDHQPKPDEVDPTTAPTASRRGAGAAREGKATDDPQ